MEDIFPEFLAGSPTKAKIFSEAVALFAEKGYNGVSMRELSERTQVSKPTIYYYFGSKEGIYTTLMQAVLNYNLEAFQAIVRRKIPIKEKITEMTKLRFSQVRQHPNVAKFFLFLFTTPEKLPFIKDFVNEALQRRKLLTDLIKEGISSGEFGPTANPELAAEIYVATITHYTWKQLNNDNQLLTDQLAEEIVNLLFKGLNE